MTPSRSEFVVLRGRRIHLRIWGADDAPTFFFLHGWGDIGASAQFVVDALSPSWRVIAPDWRGFGLSQWNDGAYWFPDYLADLDALLAHFSPDESANLVGHSLGGIVSGVYAGVRPERVARFANLEGFALWVSGPGETPERFAQWLSEVRADNAAFRSYASVEEFAGRLRRDNPRLSAGRAAFLAEHSLRRADDGSFALTADPRHRWLSPVLYPLEEAKSCWRRVTAPTLWVVGRDSPVMKRFASDRDEYAARLACFRDVREVVLDDCGHNHHHDQPAALARLLDEFLAG